MRRALASFLLCGASLRVVRTDIWRHWTDEDWRIFIEAGGVVPEKLQWVRRRPDPTWWQRARLWLARIVEPA